MCIRTNGVVGNRSNSSKRLKIGRIIGNARDKREKKINDGNHVFCFDKSVVQIFEAGEDKQKTKIDNDILKRMSKKCDM